MNAPQLVYHEGLTPFMLTAASISEGWQYVMCGNAWVLWVNNGPTVTLNCAGFDTGSYVAATVTFEAPNPDVTVATSRIIEIDKRPAVPAGVENWWPPAIEAAFNDAINQAWALMQHLNP